MSEALMNTGGTVHLLMHDGVARDEVGAVLEAVGLLVEVHDGGERFLTAFADRGPSCVVAELGASEVDGAALLASIAERGWTTPVVFLTEPGSLVDAIATLKQGAFDFVEKPVRANVLVDRTQAALERDRVLREAVRERASRVTRIPGLTQREHEVVTGVVGGSSNRIIGMQLGISPRTVEVYRAQAMRKLGARSVAELIHIVMRQRPGVDE
jgi:two-component system response regulator FixJ